MTSLFIFIALGIIPIGLITYYVWDTYKTVVDANSYTVRREDNNDDKAIRDAIRLVERSRDSLFMYDDGDKIAKSIYADDGFINALKGKLSANSAYKLQVFFACRDGIGASFAAKFAEYIAEERVEVYFPKESESAADRLHYKIADDGEIMYFSEHELGSPERKTALLEKKYDLKRSHFKELAKTYKSRFQEMCGNGDRYSLDACSH